ncbi:MAG TPA: tripartite tricarboxylate transporter substrate binding protein [Pseudolabrys sp.]|nr:tripartite tricarboxylate transporter substrate binding protein [Pseudolabrys sp.]
MSRRGLKTAALLAALTAAMTMTAHAQSAVAAFPTKPVTIVVPYPAGGAADVAVRPIVDRMAEHLGQPVIIENAPGAGSTIGTNKVVRAAADGYTLLAQQVSLAAIPGLFPNLNIEVDKKLTGIGLINTNPSLIVGRASLEVKDFAELVAWMKKDGPNVRFAHAGAGTMAHLCAALFARSIGTEVNIIPYRGGNAVNTDIIGGHVDLFCSGAGLVLEHVKSGRMKAFASTSKERYAPLPDTPTVVELGMPELEIKFWQGLFAPTGTPQPIIDKLNAALRHALADPKVIKSFAANGMSVFPADEQTPDAATKLLQSETKRWGEVIRVNNITVTP